METENEINKEIIDTTLGIQKYFPELSEYLNEMPVTIPNVANPEITKANLKDYNDSLHTLVIKYSKSEKL